jgi:hypothetical protein
MSANVSSGRVPPDQESLPGLLSRLVGDARALLHNEIALAKSELSDAATNAKLGLAALAVAFAVLLAGAMSLIAAAILALAEVMSPWAAALIVGAILTVVGVALFAGAKRKLAVTARPIPRTERSVQEDAAIIARRT